MSGNLETEEGRPGYSFLKIEFDDELFESCKVVPIIDRRYPLTKVEEVMRYYGEGNVLKNRY